MAIEIQCPGCEECYESPDRHAGKEIPCPNCGGPILVRPPDTLEVECDDCGQYYAVPERHAGTTINCPACGGTIDVPEETEEDEAAGGTSFEVPTIEIVCPDCAQEYASPTRHAGKTIDCPECGGAIKVPRLQQSAARGNGQVIRKSAEGATVEIVCPGCSRRYASPKRAAGKTINCPDCQTAIKVPEPSLDELVPDCTRPGYKEMRLRNLATLGKLGFTVAPSLAIERQNDELRPAEEIARRLWGLGVFYLFVTVPEKKVSTAAINECQKRDDLASALTKKERAMFAQPRGEAHERFADMLGWHVENMIPLAWILGFDVALVVEGTKVGEGLIEKMLFDFLGDLAQPLATWIESHPPREKMVVLEKEDLFFCAHSAVRKAQFGDDTLPEGYHPVINGGVILERRHALTWAISLGAAWDDTDLST